MIDFMILNKTNRSPIKRVGYCSRFGHAMYNYGISIICCLLILYLLVLFPYLAIYYTEENRGFYNSLKSGTCNMSNVIAANQLPNVSNAGWMPCKCGSTPSFMSCIKLFTNESNTSLVRPYYDHIKYYEHIHIPGKFDVCTFMGKCACTNYELSRQLNESITTFNKYYNKLTKCHHDKNYENIYLKLGDFVISLLVGIPTIILLLLTTITLIYTVAFICYIMGYVFGSREFLDSYDEKAYNNNIYLCYDSKIVGNPVYNTDNLPEWPDSNRDNLDYYYTRTRIHTDNYEV